MRWAAWLPGFLCTLGVLGVLGAAAPASAQGSLVIRTVEHGDWARAVVAMQTDPAWQGRTVRVVVQDAEGRRSSCGRYRLALDAHGERAFERGACDPRTGATELRLVDRAALFETGDGFARPRTVGVRAVETREGTAEGRATPPVGTELRCNLAIRPYVVDLLSGRRVRATPDRFELRPIGDGVSVVAAGDEWQVRSSFVRVRYELLDRASGEVVLRDSARLECSRGADDPLSRANGWHANIEGRDVVWLQSGREYRGRAGLGTAVDDRGSCGGEGGAESWYAVRFETAHHLALGLHSELDAALYVRAGSIRGSEVLCRDTRAQLETVDTVLPPGTYFIAVDGLEGLAPYRLSAFFDPAGGSTPPPVARATAPVATPPVVTPPVATPPVVTPVPTPRAADRPELEIDRVLGPGPSRVQASCGGTGAPEHVFRLHVGAPSRVSVRLESRFDAALSLRAEDGREIDCARGLGGSSGLRHASVSGVLPVGSYQVVVDGAGGSETGAYHLTMGQRPEE